MRRGAGGQEAGAGRGEGRGWGGGLSGAKHTRVSVGRGLRARIVLYCIVL